MRCRRGSGRCSEALLGGCAPPLHAGARGGGGDPAGCVWGDGLAGRLRAARASPSGPAELAARALSKKVSYRPDKPMARSVTPTRGPPKLRRNGTSPSNRSFISTKTRPRRNCGGAGEGRPERAWDSSNPGRSPRQVGLPPETCRQNSSAAAGNASDSGIGLRPPDCSPALVRIPRPPAEVRPGPRELEARRSAYLAAPGRPTCPAQCPPPQSAPRKAALNRLRPTVSGVSAAKWSGPARVCRHPASRPAQMDLAPAERWTCAWEWAWAWACAWMWAKAPAGQRGPGTSSRSGIGQASTRG